MSPLVNRLASALDEEKKRFLIERESVWVFLLEPSDK